MFIRNPVSKPAGGVSVLRRFGIEPASTGRGAIGDVRNPPDAPGCHQNDDSLGFRQLRAVVFPAAPNCESFELEVDATALNSARCELASVGATEAGSQTLQRAQEYSAVSGYILTKNRPVIITGSGFLSSCVP